MKAFLWVLAIGSICGGAYGQTPPRPEFEVASIKPAAEIVAATGAQVRVGVHIDGAQLRVNYFSLTDLIRVAYGVKNYQVVGPEWIEGSRFDVAAKIPEVSTRAQINDMLKSLLEDRFELRLHHDKKEFPVYALVVAKSGLRIKESPLDPVEGTGPAGAAPAVNVSAAGSAQGVGADYGRGSSISFADNKLEVHKMAMSTVTDWLSRYMDKPVVDATNTTATYDLTLDVTPEDYRVMLIRSAVSAGVVLPPEALRLLDGATTDSLLQALDRCGLKLESRRAPLDVLVVDHVLKTPIEN